MSSSSINEMLSHWRKINPVNSQSKSSPSLEALNKISKFFPSGPFYYYIINFNTLSFEYVHPSIWNVLGISHDQLDVA